MSKNLKWKRGVDGDTFLYDNGGETMFWLADPVYRVFGQPINEDGTATYYGAFGSMAEALEVAEYEYRRWKESQRQEEIP